MQETCARSFLWECVRNGSSI